MFHCPPAFPSGIPPVSISCRNCQRQSVAPILDFGHQPVSSRFGRTPMIPGDLHPLTLGQCESCSTLQLIHSFPTEVLRPDRPMLYREPERHLDDVIADILNLNTGRSAHTAFGLTYKDASALDRLRTKGFHKTWHPVPADFGITEPFANIETVQAHVTPESMVRMRRDHGNADILVARHILEHCDDPLRFLAGVSEIMEPEAILVVEVPDCTKSLCLQDYAMVWEEHTLYFTPATVRSLFAAAGFEILSLRIHPCPFEDLVVAIAQKTDKPSATDAPSRDELDLARKYADYFPVWTDKIRQWLAQATQPRCLFGAGHLTAAFVNYHRVAEFFEFVVDDNDWKTGNLLPGTALPILPSSRLIGMSGGTCFLGVSPELESRIREQNAPFLRSGGSMASLLADSLSSMRRSTCVPR